MPTDSVSNRNRKKDNSSSERQRDKNRPEDRSVEDEVEASERDEQQTGFASQARESAGQVYERFEDAVHGHEGSAVAFALTVGFGLGIAIGTALAKPRRRPTSWRERLMAEDISQRVLHRLEGMLPQSLSNYFSK